MARFFIDRPIFAWVIAIVIMLAGVLSIRSLPIEQYPTIAPPTVQINASYPGASAETVEDAVTQVIEQNMNGLDGLLYMSSSSSASGSASITLTFDASVDPDIAQVQVQNKLQLATPLLPQAVQRQGIQVTKSASGFLMVVGLVSTDGTLTNNDLGDYIASSVLDPISRVDGVGNTRLLGSQAAMRIWLDPEKLTSYALAVSDVASAVEAQNAQVSAGELGGLPAVEGQQLNATITAQTRLRTAEEFRNIVIRANADGAAVRLRDVARVELGSQSYSVIAQFSGKPASGLGIYLATGANALETADAVKARLEELSALFPPGVEVVVPYDSTPFVRLSIDEVVKTLIEAVFLVFLVMYLFLGNLRATFVPAIAVPVVLLGTFAVLSALGFSINTLTMFATVLAIGLLVDDAIVVVENVERIMHEEGLSPLEATRRSMDQITGALIGIATVLSAVFVPMAFFGGSTGAIYRQFSITIVSAMALSVLVALTLSPALCATILKPPKPDHGNGGFFGAFNRWFERSAGRYQGIVGTLLQKSLRMMLIYLALGGVMVFLFLRMPTAFLPDEDQGTLMVMAQLPPGATQQRTQQAMREVQKYFLAQEPVKSIFTVAGFSFSGQGQNAGMGFVHLRDWSLRPGSDQSAQAIAQKANRALSQVVRDASIFVIAPPPIRALGTSSGFDVQMQDLGGVGHDVLVQARNQFLALAAQRPELVAVRPNGMDDTPQFKIDVDADQAGTLGVAMSDVNTTLSTLLGGTYINDFIDGTRVKRVYMQADAPARMLPDDIKRFHVRNNTGAMVPLSAFSTAYWTYGSPKLERYNGQSSIEILGAPAPGVSSGEAMAAVEQIMQQLPAGISYQWTGLSYQERLSGSQAPALYALSMLIVFLCLAALYESWSVPFAVMLVVPLGVIGALAAAGLRGLSNDVYFQVGLLTTIGLSAKNAILIVEFAKSEMDRRGVPLIEATMTAVRLRLRPILMTSLAFMLGVLPLAIASGAGSGSQNAIGTGVLGGMLSATVLGLFFIPVFFVMVRSVIKPKRTSDTASTSTPEVPR